MYALAEIWIRISCLTLMQSAMNVLTVFNAHLNCIGTSDFDRNQFSYSCTEMDSSLSRRKHGYKQAYSLHIQVTHVHVLR